MKMRALRKRQAWQSFWWTNGAFYWGSSRRVLWRDIYQTLQKFNEAWAALASRLENR